MKDILKSVDQREIRREQITLLVRTYYEKFDFLRYEPLSLLIDKSLQLFLDSDLSIEEINEKLMEAILERKKALDERYDSKKVLKNHETIYGRLEQLARLMNEAGLDYQLAGALCGYLKYGIESDRCHDDIDICLNEEDFDKFKKIVFQLGLFFEDNRFNCSRVLKDGIPSGEHEVIARDPNSDFHIGVFCIERLPNQTVVNKGYYHDEKGVPCCREVFYYSKVASCIFGGDEVDFRGTPIKITPPEYVYILKGYTHNQKDQHDMEAFRGKIDMEKMNKIKKLLETYSDSRYVQVTPPEKKDDDLGLVLADDEKGKQKVKDMSDEGFISNAIITTLALLTFSLSFIGMAIIYLLVH